MSYQPQYPPHQSVSQRREDIRAWDMAHAYGPPNVVWVQRPPGQPGQAIAGLVLGILSLAMLWLPLPALALGLVGAWLAGDGLHESRKRFVSATMARWALGLSFAGVALAIILTIVWM